jgi:diphthamide biosynthesis protein 2
VRSSQLNSIFNQKEFLRPIMTPYELELGLVEDKSWDGGYDLDFR